MPLLSVRPSSTFVSQPLCNCSEYCLWFLYNCSHIIALILPLVSLKGALLLGKLPVTMNMNRNEFLLAITIHLLPAFYH